MDNKKQQNSRSVNAKPSLIVEFNRKSSDSQSNNPKNLGRREQHSISRSENQRNSNNNQKQHLVAKLRPNADKRLRPRSAGRSTMQFNGSANERFLESGSRLATSDVAVRTADEYELNSVYVSGSKKQNLNHLLNFHYTPRDSDYTMYGSMLARCSDAGASTSRCMKRQNQIRKQRYNKEQYLQANFQFVIRASAMPQLTASPDNLMDWSSIEQINIQTTEEPKCPICLYPPIAPKLTRCGHVYCWPCLLHYLSLSDKAWRKCPICYDAINAGDLKSCIILQQRSINIGNKIIFHLMRRRKGSMYIERYNTVTPTKECYPLICQKKETKLYSKFLIAKRADIADIIERERIELTVNEDISCPDYVFIQQALIMLNERSEKLGIVEEPKDNKGETPTNNLVISGPQNSKGENYTNSSTDSVKEQSSSGNSTVLEENFTEANIGTTSTNNNKYYHFYQSEDGQNIYLHPLNVKMLQAYYGTLDHAPLVIEARVIQKEQHSMDEYHRRKFTFLGHLPLTCQFSVVEVDLKPPIVSNGILNLFKDDIFYRKQERQRREREERKREKQINELNDRQMGKLIASTANLNLNSADEFPTWSFEESLSMQRRDNYSTASISHEAVRATTTSMGDHSTVSYSSVAVVGVGKSHKMEYWPPIDSTSAMSSAKHTEQGAWGREYVAPVITSNQSSHVTTEHIVGASKSDAELHSLSTNLSDVLTEAISQNKQRSTTSVASCSSGTKKKKNKKILPIFATGINCGGI